MNGLKIVFMGTPEFAVPSLRKIAQSRHQVAAVVTQPDKPRGRGQKVISTAVKKAARELDLSPVWQPERLRSPDFIAKLESLGADLFVVVAFRILPEAVFSIPQKGTINLHPSLLPKYRGAAPLNWTVINGERETGLTIIRISADIDAGNILLQKKVPVLPDETAGSLHDRLAEDGAALLLEAINRIQSADISEKPQPAGQSTPAPKITRELRHVRFNHPAGSVRNLIHGLSPYPAAFAVLNGKVIKFYKARTVDEFSAEYEPGTVVRAKNGVLRIACEPGIIEILELQLEGKKRLSSSAFLRGFPVVSGEQFQ